MRKPPLSLALSVSLVLLQANLLPALSEPASTSIWQKLADANSSAVVKNGSAAKKSKTITHSASHAVVSKAIQSKSTKIAAADNKANGQAMLFLSGKNKSGNDAAPAAVLTIHPSMSSAAPQVAAAQPTQPKPTLIAMNGTTISDVSKSSGASPVVTPVSDNVPVASVTTSAKPDPKTLLAELAPDQIIAQGDNNYSSTNATPIPPVVSGTVDLEEFKSSNVIDLKVSQSRTFRLKNKIIRTSISDPAIAEPVVVSENQIVLLGKAPGGATLVVWDDAGNSVAIDLHVTRDYSVLQNTLRDIDPRIIVKPFSVSGSDRVILMGDVDHPESVIRAFSAANAFMDDRGIKIIAANGRLLDAKLGEQGGASGGGGGQTGQLAQLSQVDKYTFFANTNSNVSKAEAMVSDGGRVTSLVRVRKTPLIVLHLTFLEMNTAAVRELGIQLGMNYSNSSFAFGVGGQNGVVTSGTSQFLTSSPGFNQLVPVTANAIVPNIGAQVPVFGIGTGGVATQTGFTAQPPAIRNGAAAGSVTPAGFGALSTIPTFINGVLTPNPVSQIGLGALGAAPVLLGQSFLFGSPGGATFNPNSLANLWQSVANIGSHSTRFSLNPAVNGIISQSRARVLSEPTLVTISGERASFLAGGEIPIVQSIATAGTAQQSVVYEPFGMRLNIIPVLLENGVINLQVSPEERLLSQTNALTISSVSAFPIPGFTTRKMQTIVELKPGQELFISGLISANSGREVDKTPVLGEVPVLGALYKSKAFNKNESELVISVRPEIVIPGAPGQLKLPEDIGKTEGPRDLNIFQVEPTVIDERYMTSGAAERQQSIPNVLPANAPIPDSP